MIVCIYGRVLTLTGSKIGNRDSIPPSPRDCWHGHVSNDRTVEVNNVSGFILNLVIIIIEPSAAGAARTLSFSDSRYNAMFAPLPQMFVCVSQRVAFGATMTNLWSLLFQ